MVFIFPGLPESPHVSTKGVVTMKLTQASLARLDMPEGKTDHIEFDETRPGFGVRIRGKKKIGTRHRRINLGNVAKVNLEDARRQAKIIFGKVAVGEDPAADKTAAKAEASRTLDAIVARYLEAKR
jgi:Arm domain-containing DNA-binding protein